MRREVALLVRRTRTKPEYRDTAVLSFCFDDCNIRRGLDIAWLLQFYGAIRKLFLGAFNSLLVISLICMSCSDTWSFNVRVLKLHI